MVPLKLKYYILAWYVWMHDFVNNRIKNNRILFIKSCNGQKSEIKKQMYQSILDQMNRSDHYIWTVR